MARGHMIADAVAIIGTMDIVFGEIDDDEHPDERGSTRDAHRGHLAREGSGQVPDRPASSRP
jgi:hypothetical protein